MCHILKAVVLQVGAGFWVTDDATLRTAAERLAKDQFARKRDPADAALQYMALGKRSLLQASVLLASLPVPYYSQ